MMWRIRMTSVEIMVVSVFMMSWITFSRNTHLWNNKAKIWKKTIWEILLDIFDPFPQNGTARMLNFFSHVDKEQSALLSEHIFQSTESSNTFVASYYTLIHIDYLSNDIYTSFVKWRYTFCCHFSQCRFWNSSWPFCILLQLTVTKKALMDAAWISH